MVKKSFSERVYDLVIKIPPGRVSTYGNIAHALNLKAYRAVGNAMNKNPHAPSTPCHRVISSNGTLGGYSKGIKKKIQLLKSEGVEIKNNKIDLERFGYFFN